MEQGIVGYLFILIEDLCNLNLTSILDGKLKVTVGEFLVVILPICLLYFYNICEMLLTICLRYFHGNCINTEKALVSLTFELLISHSISDT